MCVRNEDGRSYGVKLDCGYYSSLCGIVFDVVEEKLKCVLAVVMKKKLKKEFVMACYIL